MLEPEKSLRVSKKGINLGKGTNNPQISQKQRRKREYCEERVEEGETSGGAQPRGRSILSG